MKRLVFGAVTVAILTAAWASGGDAPTMPAPRVSGVSAASDGLVVAPSQLGEKTQVLTVVDPRRQVLCVYHVDLATGKIALRAVRNIQWDLQVTYLNNENPLPQEIRALLEQR